MPASNMGPRRLPPDEPDLVVSPTPRRLARPVVNLSSPSAPLASAMLNGQQPHQAVEDRLPHRPPRQQDGNGRGQGPTPGGERSGHLLSERTWTVSAGPPSLRTADTPAGVSVTPLPSAMYGSAPLRTAEPAALAYQSRFRPVEVSVDDVYGPSLTPDDVDGWVDAPVIPHQPVVSAVRAVTYVAVLAGSALFGIWLYQTHISDFLAHRAQERLERSLPVFGSDVAGPDWQSPIVAADGSTAPPPPPGVVAAGTAIGKISAPSIGLEYAIVAGVGADELRSGPGWMQNTAFPGQLGNSVLSGHRTTHGAPFRNIDDLKLGDRLTVTVPGRPAAVFEVRAVYVVEPTAVWVAAPTEGVRLTLTTCHPEGSDTERLVVQAELVEGENVASAVPADVWQRSQVG